MGDAIRQVVQTRVARLRESCVVCGQISRRTHVVTMVGSRIPARFAVVSSTHPTRQGGRQGWYVAAKRFACSKVWMQVRQTVPKNKGMSKEGRTKTAECPSICIVLFWRVNILIRDAGDLIRVR